MIEVVVGEIKLLKVNKLDEAAIGVNRTIKRTITEVKADYKPLISYLVAPFSPP